MMTIFQRIILSGLIVLPLCANKSDETYYRANKLLKAGRHQEALDDYQLLTPQGPATYYNTGIALYHLQQYGKALAAWGKAEQYAGTGLLKKILYNKNKAYQKLELELPESWYTLLWLIQSRFSLFLLQVLFLLAWFGWCFSNYIQSVFIKKYRIILLVISMLCGPLLALKYWVHEYKRAVVTVPHVNVFVGPNTEFDVIAELKEGEQIKVVQQENSWYKIKYRKIYGWIQDSTIEQIT
jgi:tetratricopeptide (TPR) repeat protein